MSVSQRVEAPHSAHGAGLPDVRIEFVDADLDAGAREDPVEDEAQMVSDLLDALVEPLGALVRVGRDEGGAESPPVDDGSVRGVRTGDPEGLPGEGVAHLAGVEGLDAGGVVLGDTLPDRYSADGAAADVEDIGLAEGGGFEAQTVVTEVAITVARKEMTRRRLGPFMRSSTRNAKRQDAKILVHIISFPKK